MSVKFIVYTLVIFLSTLRYGLECNGQDEYSFRQHMIDGAAYLQIFYIQDAGDSGLWYDLRLSRFDYRETFYACKNLSDTAMVEFTGMRNEGGFRQFNLRCNNLPNDVSGCDTTEPSSVVGRVVQLTCLNYNDYNEGDVLQLEDGRIIQLVEFSNGKFVWAHYCFEESNWGVLEANLTCKSLGFDRVKEGSEKMRINNKRVYGLINIDCDMAKSISQCISTPVINNARCDGESVIAIECENIPTLPNSKINITQPVSTSEVTKQSVTITTQRSYSQMNRTPLITAVIVSLSFCIVLTLIVSLIQIFGIILMKMLGGYIFRKRSHEYQADQTQN